jgi:hypothetical protein
MVDLASSKGGILAGVNADVGKFNNHWRFRASSKPARCCGCKIQRHSPFLPDGQAHQFNMKKIGFLSFGHWTPSAQPLISTRFGPVGKRERK